MPSDLSVLSKGELITFIHKLLREIDTLKETIIELQEKLKQKGQGDETFKQIPSFVKANLKKKREAERKQREQGFSRKLDIPTKRVSHPFECCPDCSETLGKPSVAYSRQIIDIPPISAEITEHVVFKRYCFHCRKRFYPKIDLSPQVLGKRQDWD